MATDFVVLSTQRSGSTWVIDMLNSHPCLTAYGELFLSNGRGNPPWGAGDLEFFETYREKQMTSRLVRDHNALIRAYLDEVYSRRPPVDAVGFKLMYGQAGSYPEVIGDLFRRRATIIHLIRRNYLDIVISKNVAAGRDQFHVRRTDSIRPIRIVVNVGELVKRLERHDHEIRVNRERFSGGASPYFEVYYEDLTSDSTGFDELVALLAPGNRPFRLESPLKKLVTESHIEIVENYDQVQNVLKGTRFETMLE